MVGSFSDHGRIILGSFSDGRIGPALEMTFQLFSRTFCENLESHFAWQAQYLGVWTMTLGAPRIVNSVSCVTRINHEIHFSWQAQYLVSLDNDICYSAHCK